MILEIMVFYEQFWYKAILHDFGNYGVFLTVLV